ncbi:radical SAM protein [Selenomonas sp.]|uniref:radical SAM/SPASM domain-containing protein n=1 Tax=Selenomonas sp. TaxID=2053611 RepID=UPI002A7F49D5|nr:radical SAM protein [Selenomonas sp.]MDY4415592.1 radical SAM protein [Selenomonas sp.]
MGKRTNPFVPIYRTVNGGTNEEKYHQILTGGTALPKYLDVELTNCCNFRCCFCPTGTKSMKRMKGFMTDEVADALAENVQKYHIPAVRFIRWGEPTLHPHYLDILEKVKQAGALIHINTNGSLLDEAQIERLLDMHLDSIKFSFQGADEGTYNEMREGGDYQHLLGTIRRFHAMRGDRDYPFIQISTTLTGETAEQVESFQQDVGAYCDYYNIGYTMLNHLDVDAMHIDDAEKEKIRKLQEHERCQHTYRAVCAEAFDKLSVNWNGDVTLCCSDYDNFMIVGNILDHDIREIYNSRATKGYREAIARHEYGKIACCSICYDIIPVTK